jgi:hypothetical protein
MLRTASYITLGISALVFAVNVSPVSAATANTSVSVSNNGEGAKTNVHVETNTGGNTICQNGKCTTTSSNGKSTVCVNGVCNTNEDGDVNYQSENGNTKVNIQTNGEENGDQGVVTKKGVPTITPTVFKDTKEVKGAKTKAEDIKKQVKAKIEKEKEKGFNLLNFLEAEFEGIKNIFSFWK